MASLHAEYSEVMIVFNKPNSCLSIFLHVSNVFQFLLFIYSSH